MCKAFCLKSIYSALCFPACHTLEMSVMETWKASFWSKTKSSVRQIRRNSPFYLIRISVSWLTVKKKAVWKHTDKYMHADLARGQHQSAMKFLRLHLGTHENGNGRSWSGEWNQFMYPSGLFIKVKHCLLDPLIFPNPVLYMTLTYSSTHSFNGSRVFTKVNVRGSETT